MYARVLRKWSLAKFLMYLWLPVMMLLVIWCQGAASMHLSGINGGAAILAEQNQHGSSNIIKSPLYGIGSSNYNSYHRTNYDQRFRNYDNHHIKSLPRYQYRRKDFANSGLADKAATPISVAASIVPNVPKLNSQITNNLNYNINNINNNNNKNNTYYSNSRNNLSNLTFSANNNFIYNGRKYKRHIQGPRLYDTPLTSSFPSPSSDSRVVSTEATTRITRIPMSTLRHQNTERLQGYTGHERNPYRNGQYENVGSRIIEVIATSTRPFTTRTESSSSTTSNRLASVRNEEETLNSWNKSMRREGNNANDQFRNSNSINERNDRRQISPTEEANWLNAQREKRIRTESLRRRFLKEHGLPDNQDNLRNTSDHQQYVKANNRTWNNTSFSSNNSRSIHSESDTKVDTLAPVNNSYLDKFMIGRNRRDSRLYSPWQLSPPGNRQRKRPRRYCSARDPSQLAFEAPTVFEGKVRSMSSDRRRNFSATFEVKEVFKNQNSYTLPPLLRLQFTYRNTTSECDIYREHLRPRGLVRDELEQGRIYILFVKQIDIGNFTILGTPVKKTRRAVNAVKIGVSKDYAQPASIKSLTANRSNRTVIQEGEELRIVCKVKGQPPPKVTWFKDDKSINRNRKMYQFIHLKKRSELVISSFKSTDAGHYECRAKNKVTKRPDKRVIRIEAAQKPTRRNEQTFSHLSGDQCPEEWQAYCLNGATCKYFKEVSLCSCTCPDGYIGDRCQTKEPTTFEPSPTFKSRYLADSHTMDGHDEDDDDISDSDEYHTTVRMPDYSKTQHDS